MKQLHAVYCRIDNDRIISIHKTVNGAEKNMKAQKEYHQDDYYVDYIVVWD